MTSNVGASTIKKQNTFGFGMAIEKDKQEQDEYKRMKEGVMTELKKNFKPEFLNRIDDIIVFHSLTQKDIEKIVHLMTKSLEKRLLERGITISLDEQAMKIITQEGYDLEFGARPLKRAIQKLLEDPIAEMMLRGDIKEEQSLVITGDGEKLKIESKVRS